MRLALLTGLLCFLWPSVHAQEPADALKFSWNFPFHSARISSIGGAGISLGGDISSTFINPAGLAFYRTGDFVLTPAGKFGKTKSAYRGERDNASNGQGSWGTSGLVLGGGAGRKGKNTAFSIAVSRSANFHSDIQYRGRNNQSSFSQRFTEELEAANINTSAKAEYLFPFGASLAYNTRWIDSVSDGMGGINRFRTNAPVATGLLQQNTINSSGGVSEFALGIGSMLHEKLMVGGTLGIPIVNYTRKGEFLEADATNNRNNAFDYGMFSDELKTTGAGINLKAGLIYKPAAYWRLGLTFHSPGFYALTDQYEATVVLNDDVADDQAWVDKTTNYLNGAPNQFKYLFTSPLKVGVGLSYVLREVSDVSLQKGFITADVELVNHGASRFSMDPEGGNDASTRAYLSKLNTAIGKAYKTAVNARIGGELKFTTVMVRAGAAYFGNPYNNMAGENGNILNLTGGAGYRNKGYFIDLAYVHSRQRDVHFPYRLQKAPFSGAALSSVNHHLLLSLGVKL